MTRVETTLPVPPGEAFRILEDPRSLRILVLGARRIRRFDPGWPAPGSEVHHSVGLFPFIVRDTTEVIECDQDHRLVLEARVQAVGVFRVVFELADEGDGGTRLAVEEQVIKGAFSLPIVRSLVETGVKARNAELCHRYTKLVEQRQKVARTVGRA